MKMSMEKLYTFYGIGWKIDFQWLYLDLHMSKLMWPVQHENILTKISVQNLQQLENYDKETYFI